MRNRSQWSSSDRYEWLSAYLDDELAPLDRHRVEEWLACDPEYQACYQRLRRMHQSFQGLRALELANLPQPSPQELLEQSPWVRFAKPRQQTWKKEITLAVAGLSGLGLALFWATGLRSFWAEPIAKAPSSQVQAQSQDYSQDHSQDYSQDQLSQVQSQGEQVAIVHSHRVQPTPVTPASVALDPIAPAPVALDPVTLDPVTPAPVAPIPSSASPTSTVFVSIREAESELTFALDQPLLALPPE